MCQDVIWNIWFLLSSLLSSPLFIDLYIVTPSSVKNRLINLTQQLLNIKKPSQFSCGWGVITFTLLIRSLNVALRTFYSLLHLIRNIVPGPHECLLLGALDNKTTFGSSTFWRYILLFDFWLLVGRLPTCGFYSCKLGIEMLTMWH